MAGLCCFAVGCCCDTGSEIQKISEGFSARVKRQEQGGMGIITTRPPSEGPSILVPSPPSPLSLSSDISGGAAAALRADTITRGCGDPREAEGGGTEGGGCAAGYVVIWAVISTAVRCGAGGGDERSER